MLTRRSHCFCVPWRDRGLDPLRQANLTYVTKCWLEYLDLGPVYVVSDGRSGTEQFNRHAAYNSCPDANVITYYESDMIIPKAQLVEAIQLATDHHVLVVPFTEYHYLSAKDSNRIRTGEAVPWDCTPETKKRNSIGAVNTVSRETLGAIGQWDESGFEGSWYDDRAMFRAFEVCCGPACYVTGPAYHLYHLPGWAGDHLSASDIAATARNHMRYWLYKRAKTPERIRELTSGAT